MGSWARQHGIVELQEVMPVAPNGPVSNSLGQARGTTTGGSEKPLGQHYCPPAYAPWQVAQPAVETVLRWTLELPEAACRQKYGALCRGAGEVMPAVPLAAPPCLTSPPAHQPAHQHTRSPTHQLTSSPRCQAAEAAAAGCEAAQRLQQWTK